MAKEKQKTFAIGQEVYSISFRLADPVELFGLSRGLISTLFCKVTAEGSETTLELDTQNNRVKEENVFSNEEAARARLAGEVDRWAALAKEFIATMAVPNDQPRRRRDQAVVDEAIRLLRD